MIVRGMDFTSRPGIKKPITCANCTLTGQLLEVDDFRDLYSFELFEELLDAGGEWIAGLDFPFGQSRILINNIGWPTTWEGYVGIIANMSRSGFVALLAGYREDRAKGNKEHRRKTDIRARSRSPQSCCKPPVALMF
jgi:hypothetical protein